RVVPLVPVIDSTVPPERSRTSIHEVPRNASERRFCAAAASRPAARVALVRVAGVLRPMRMMRMKMRAVVLRSQFRVSSVDRTTSSRVRRAFGAAFRPG
ncbi:MAG TPA: hypothetical protein PK479_05105, partial [Novosphingobium sp.]|nr:hypothetical protein [Novosphingobium sp.]